MNNVLLIGGTDPLLGAGVGADLRVVSAHGLCPIVLETAFVCQNSQGVRGFHSHDARFFSERLLAVLEDVPIHGVKIGMLGSAAIADVVCAALQRPALCGVPVVLDPVLASGGETPTPLSAQSLVDALRRLVSHVTLVTPNRTELERLTRRNVASHQEAFLAVMSAWGERGSATLIKGGHFEPRGLDMLACLDADGAPSLTHVYQGTPWPVDIHGTGCHLASSIAARLVHGASLQDACEGASAWLHGLVAHGAYRRVGQGRFQFDASQLHCGIR